MATGRGPVGSLDLLFKNNRTLKFALGVWWLSAQGEEAGASTAVRGLHLRRAETRIHIYLSHSGFF